MKLQRTCKICKREFVLSVDLECPKEWIDKLLPLATCNHCYDTRLRREKAAGKLFKIGNHIAGLRLAQMQTAETEKKLRPGLERLAHEYMSALAEQNFKSWRGDVSEFVEWAIAKPDEIGRGLRFLRENFATLV